MLSKRKLKKRYIHKVLNENYRSQFLYLLQDSLRNNHKIDKPNLFDDGVYTPIAKLYCKRNNCRTLDCWFERGLGISLGLRKAVQNKAIKDGKK